jgi:hypothetical protein
VPVADGVLHRGRELADERGASRHPARRAMQLRDDWCRRNPNAYSFESEAPLNPVRHAAPVRYLLLEDSTRQLHRS